MKTFLSSIMLVLSLCLALPGTVQAAAVGKLTQMEGRVDLLKGGKIPATPMKLGEAVEPGDVLRTKSLSKAQITFLDNSVVTISPESRLAIEEYLIDTAKGKRNAVLQLFQGLAYIVVNKIYQVDEPDFLIKTHTAVTGVRGSELGIRNHPNSTSSLQFDGRSQVNNVDPFVAGRVMLNAMQGTETFRGLPPTMPFDITKEDQQQFMRQLNVGLMGRRGGPGQTAVTATGPAGGTGAATPAALSAETTGTPGAVAYQPEFTGTTQVVSQIVVIPPNPAPTPTPTPQPGTFSFTQTIYGAWLQQSGYPYSQAKLYAYGWGQRTGVYAGYFYSLTEATRTSPSSQTNFYNNFMAGTSSSTATGTVTGYLGQALTGTMTLTGPTTTGSSISRTGTITIQPSGQATYTWTDTVTGPSGQAAGTGSGTTTQTPGTYFTQSASGTLAETSAPPYSDQVVRNSGAISGTRTGVQPGSFTASLSADSSANIGTFNSGGSYPTSFSTQGVVDTSTGKGAMTSTASNPTVGQSTVGGPVTMQSDGTLISQLIGGQYNNPTTRTNYINTRGMWAQTSNANAQPFTQTAYGSADMTVGNPTTTGTFSGNAWGMNNINGGATTYTVGPISGTLTDSNGNPINSGPFKVNHIVAGVLTAGTGGTYTGVAQGFGRIPLDTVFMTQGTVSIDASGNGTYNFTGNGVTPTSQVTISNGTGIQQPGTLFSQTATGTVTSSSSSPFQQQTTANQGTITGTRTGVLPGTFSITPGNLQITSNAPSGVTNVFAAGPTTNNVTLNSQGVVRPTPTPGTYSGAMTTWATIPSGGNLGTFNGPVTIQSPGNLNAPNLVGPVRVQTPAGNLVPVSQTGSMIQTY